MTLVTNSSGGVMERLAYDAWGKRRFPNGSDDPGNTINPTTGHRGFTTHEHLEEVALVHMNGRIYDPLLGRFVTPDPFIQASMDLQSYNRYSYVLNNPLAYTDPSGYWSLRKSIQRFVHKVEDSASTIVKSAMHNPLKTAVIIAAAYYTGFAANSLLMSGGSATFVAGGALTMAGSAVVGAASGAAASFIGSGGDLRATVKGAFTGAFLGAVDSGLTSANASNVTSTAAKSLAGGVASEIQGGRFEDGLYAGAVTSGARYVYNSVAGRDVRPESGENRTTPNMARGPDSNQYEPGPRQVVPANWGWGNAINENRPLTGDFWKDFTAQSGALSQVLNVHPIGNATSYFHDPLDGVINPDRNSLFKWSTIPGSAMLTYAATLDKLNLNVIHVPRMR